MKQCQDRQKLWFLGSTRSVKIPGLWKSIVSFELQCSFLCATKECCTQPARCVSNSFVKMFNFSCLFELFPLQRRKCFPGLWNSPCWQKSAKRKDCAAFCKIKRYDFHLLNDGDGEVLWSSKLRNTREKEGEKVYNAVIRCCLRTSQSSSKDPFRLIGTRKTRDKMDAWNIKSGHWKKKLALALFWSKKTHTTCEISI